MAGRALPWRVRGCPDPGAGRVPGRFGASAPNLPAGLLEGFTPEPRPDERLALNSNGRLLLLRLADISWLEATDHGAVLHVGTEAHLIRDTLAALSVKLPPGRFVRISPVALVNVRQIKGLRRLCQSEWRVLLRNGTRLTLTRGYGEHLRQAGWFAFAARRPWVRSRVTVRRPGRG